MRRAAFTLIELLVVISIIAVLAALLFAAVQRVRESANRAACQNNIRQVALALAHYHDTHGHLPAGILNPRGKSLWPAAGWQIPILPFIEQPAIFQEAMDEYKRTKQFGDVQLNSYPHTAMSHVVKAYVCPSDYRVHQRYLSKTLGYFVAFTSYVGSCGLDCGQKDGLLFMDSSVSHREITDGTSNTILLGERPPGSDLELGWWYAGLGQDGKGSAEMILGARERFTGVLGNLPPCERRVYEFTPGRFSGPCDAYHYWSPHSGGAFFAFADGSVRFLHYGANAILPALASRAGHESANLPE